MEFTRNALLATGLVCAGCDGKEAEVDQIADGYMSYEPQAQRPIYQVQGDAPIATSVDGEVEYVEYFDPEVQFDLECIRAQLNTLGLLEKDCIESYIWAYGVGSLSSTVSSACTPYGLDPQAMLNKVNAACPE